MKICERNACTGCSACQNGCPVDAIQMLPDERGFLNPVIDDEKCIKCQKCRKICPQNGTIDFHDPGRVFAALAKDDLLRNHSSSGGIFSLLAMEILYENGYVFGAAFDENMTVCHKEAFDVSGLEKLQGSKYVQSQTQNIFREVRMRLESGKKVLFSGTPCQVSGLYRYLDKNYENLLTVDILCHGVPSPKVFKEFLRSETEKMQGCQIVQVCFRKKRPGWKKFALQVIADNGDYNLYDMKESYLAGFLKDLFLRESCYSCVYARKERVGDITLGDYWGYQETGPKHIEDDDRGISLVMLNTSKGEYAFKRIKHKTAYDLRSIENAMRGNPILSRANVKPELSEAFWTDFSIMDWDDLCLKYFPYEDRRTDKMIPENKEHYMLPYKQRHMQHLIYCSKQWFIKRVKKQPRKYILYGHDGSGNHGCEALVRTTIAALPKTMGNIVLVSNKPEEDRRYEIDKLCHVTQANATLSPDKMSYSFWKAYWDLKVFHNFFPMNYLYEGTALGLQKGDVAISIGGDCYCYEGTRQNRISYNKMLRYNGVKTVFWGASIDPNLLNNPEIAEDIRHFDLITARESISYEALKMINPNTILVSDSAFSLCGKRVALPESFCKCDLVGINTSPLIESCECKNGIARANYTALIKWILHNTDMKILLIPHVEWVDKNGNTDRTILDFLRKEVACADRIYLVENSDCETLKGYISLCRFFIGARTHSTIAAYSCSIPTLAVGYSVKARGIAKDLFGEESHYVLPVQNLNTEDDLAKAFEWIIQNEDEIRTKLRKEMPEYQARINLGIQALMNL